MPQKKPICLAKQKLKIGAAFLSGKRHDHRSQNGRTTKSTETDLILVAPQVPKAKYVDLKISLSLTLFLSFSLSLSLSLVSRPCKHFKENGSRDYLIQLIIFFFF
jgi:hypothetical protein